MIRTPGTIEDIYPLSPLQEGMLFHSLYDPRGGEHLEQLHCRLRGDLDPAAFRAAWERVVMRHPVLRTGFVWERRDEPFQVVHRDVALPWREEDWSDVPAAEREAVFEDFLDRDRQAGFELSRPPLLRFLLARTDEREHRFAWTHHHLLLDGWSLPQVLGEVFELYRGAVAGREPVLPKRRPYRDFIRWLRGRDVAADEAYWRRYLAGWTHPTPLPGAGTASPGVVAAGRPGHRAVETCLKAEEGAALAAVAADLQVTPALVLQGAWALLLERWSGEQEVVFGAVTSGRPPDLDGVESMVGLFLNTLPVRAQVGPAGTAAELWRVLREAQLDQRSHLHTSLSRVRRVCELPSGAPLFETVVIFENYPLGELEVPGDLEVEGAEVREQANFPLALVVQPGDRLEIALAYDPRRLGGDIAETLLAHFTRLLAWMVGHPHRPLAEALHLSPAEEAILVRGWGEGAAMPPPGDGVAALCEGWARRRPQAVAVRCGSFELTYGELERRAAAVAARLRGAGIGLEDSVAVLLEPSVEVAIAALAAFKVGAAYLPLAPDVPGERLETMLADARVRWVLTSEVGARRLPAGLAGPLVVAEVAVAGETVPTPATRSLPHQAAYVVYTSGSTGLPKGVICTHGGLENLVRWHLRRSGLKPEDRVSQFAGLGFDASVWDLWAALASGATLCVPTGEERLSPPAIARWLRDNRVTVAWLPSPLLELLLDDGSLEATPVRYMATGADRLLGRPSAGSCFEVVNAYGPSETAVIATEGTVAPAAPELGAPDLGGPIDGARTRLVDRRFRLAAAGVPGEICVGGRPVGRGYLGKPGLTAERFVPDPWGEPGDRLYRTGDLARWTTAGRIELLGRLDTQVQVHGVRVEPGEVEAVLATHPAVRSAAVLPLPGPSGRVRLVAFVAGDGVPTGRELRGFLSGRLVEAMLPAEVVEVPQMPLTPHGKLDRHALAAAAEEVRGAEAPASAAPRSALEEQIAALFRQVLGLPRVGLDEDFFALGGDSILSLQLVSRAHRAGLRLGPRDVFENPTVVGLAVLLEARKGIFGDAVAEAPAVTGRWSPAPIQRWFLEAAPEDPHHWNQAVLLEVAERLPPSAWRRAVASLLVRHDALRGRFTWRDGEWQGWLMAPPPAPPCWRIDLSALPPARRRGTLGTAAAALQASFRLHRGLLFLAADFDLGTEGERLLLAAHHLVVDLVSWRVLVEDLEVAALAAAAGRPIRLGAKGTSVQRWSELLAEYAVAPEEAAQVSAWADAVRPGVALPTDHPEVPDREVDAEELTVLVPWPGDLAALPGRRSEAVLLTALARAIRRWAGDGAVRVDVEGHGREEIAPGVDLARTVGWLTALYPLRIEPPAHGDAVAELAAVEGRLVALRHGGVGYGALRHLHPDSDIRSRLAAPDAELRFNYAGRAEEVSAEGLFRRASENSGPLRSPRAGRRHALEVEAARSGAGFALRLAFGARRFRRATVERLAAAIQEEAASLLRALPGDPSPVAPPATFTSDEEALRAFQEVKL